mgnify:CR=1 FL=1
MKKLLLILFLFISYKTYSLPGFGRDMGGCEISFYHFCDQVGAKSYGMCPSKLKPEHKDICVVNSLQKIDVMNACNSEINKLCSSNRDDFIHLYVCLASPKKWSKFSKECLSAIGSAHKKSSKPQSI